MSILSYPERGKWGSSSWRGNWLVLFTKSCSSGSSQRSSLTRWWAVEPASKLPPRWASRVTGWTSIRDNILRHSILEAVGKPADFCFSHPPYGAMIRYSGEVWGSEPHPDDLSRCASDAEFHEKMALALTNQRNATREGGFYGTLIGDLRKDGRYVSFQSECLSRMPSTELVSVLIKAQHNTQSGRKSYGRMMYPMIQHEYILLWRKKDMPIFSFLKAVATEAQARLTGTWKNVVRTCLMGLGGTTDLPKLYAAIEQDCDKAKANPHYKEKIRQTLNTNPDLFKPVDRGVWSLA